MVYWVNRFQHSHRIFVFELKVLLHGKHVNLQLVQAFLHGFLKFSLGLVEFAFKCLNVFIRYSQVIFGGFEGKLEFHYLVLVDSNFLVYICAGLAFFSHVVT